MNELSEKKIIKKFVILCILIVVVADVNSSIGHRDKRGSQINFSLRTGTTEYVCQQNFHQHSYEHNQ